MARRGPHRAPRLRGDASESVAGRCEGGLSARAAPAQTPGPGPEALSRGPHTLLGPRLNQRRAVCARRTASLRAVRPRRASGRPAIFSFGTTGHPVVVHRRPPSLDRSPSHPWSPAPTWHLPAAKIFSILVPEGREVATRHLWSVFMFRPCEMGLATGVTQRRNLATHGADTGAGRREASRRTPAG